MTDNSCVVCFKNVRIYSVGECDHPVCYECSTRMRVLCRQNECPMCRHGMGMVIFTERIRPFRRIKRDYTLYNTDYHIAFENDYIQDAFENLLQYVCKKCHNKTFSSFDGLTEHMRRVHDLYSCDLCVDNLKIFPREWRYYTRPDLNKHRRVGDIDDRSHRGHPLCEFCNIRYVDRDELYRHLRKDHLFCHICDAEGIQQFYGMYKMLRDHYKKEHYLCEEGDCIKEEFTSVFPSEIDLKAHNALVHCKNLKNKLAVKQARTLELEFTLAPRSANDRRSRPYGSSTQEAVEEEFPTQNHFNQYAEPDTSRNVMVTWDEAAFPSLTNDPAMYSTPRSKFVRESNKRLTFNDENFPALGSETNIKFNITSSDTRPSTSSSVSSTNISLKVNRNRNRNANRAHTTGPSTSSLSLTWVEKAKEKKPVSEKVQKPLENIPFKAPSMNKNNFPKLNSANGGSGENQKKKKKSSVSIHIEENDNQKKSSYNEITNKNIVNNNNDKAEKKTQSTSKQKEKSDTPQSKDGKTNCVLLNASRKKVKMKLDADSYVPLNNLRDRKVEKESVAGSSYANSNARSQTNEKSNESASVHVTKVCDTKINGTVDKSKNVEKMKKDKCENQPRMKNKENKNQSTISKQSPKKSEKEKKNTTKDNQENLLRESNKIISKLENASTDAALSDHKNNTKKKSELKIGPLNKTANGDLNLDILDSKPSVKFPPPGFEASITPPPGLSRASPESYNRLYTDNPSFNISEAVLVYLQPDDFVSRNSDLINKIDKSLMKNNKEALNDFKNTSLLYREGYISAASYYLYCMENVENDKFDDVLVDLVVLLPNIIKQQELWAVHQTMKNDKSLCATVEPCPVCFQILKSTDFTSHLAKHSLHTNASLSARS